MKPFAVTLYTLRDLLTTPADIAATLPAVKKIGYDYVQVSGVGGASGRELRQLLDDSGLICCATHCSYDDAIERCDAVCEEMAALGALHTAVASLPASYRTADGYRAAGEALSAAAASFASRGLTLSYHNHAFEFERFPEPHHVGVVGHSVGVVGPSETKENEPISHHAHVVGAGRTGFELLFQRVVGLGMEFDTYWLVHAGCDPVAYIERFAGPMPLLHLKDKVVGSGEPVMAEVGQGNLNWPAILSAAHAKGVEWYIVEQDTCQRPPLESIALSLQFLKGSSPR